MLKNQAFHKNHNVTQENFKLSMEINAKRRRGGLQQRLDEEQRQRTRSSKLANHLLTQYAWGIMSVQEVQAFAALAVQDLTEGNCTVIFTDLVQLSKLGSSGTNKQNMSRDIQKYIESINYLPKPTMVDLPTKKENELTGVMLPHQIFSFLYEKYPTVFKKLFMPGGTQQIQDFWKQCSGAACLQGQPCLRSLNRAKAIPIGVHGDEVPIAGRGKCWVKMAIMISWFSLLSLQISAREGLLWMWAANPAQFKEGVEGTVHCFMEVLQWSIDVLFSGIWPSKDYRGIPYHPDSPEAKKSGSFLAGGHYCVLISLIGDLDYCNKFLGLPHWASASQPCSRCRCKKQGPYTWKDSRLEAPWRETIYKTADWLASEDRSRNPIFNAMNVTGLSAQPDLMHVKYLGYQQFWLGSVLWMLVHELLPASPLANLRGIGLYVLRWQRRHNVSARFPLGSFQKLSIFQRKTGYPKIRGKGAHVRHLGGALAALWNKKMSPTNPNHVRVKLIFKLDLEIESILNSHSPESGYYALPEPQALEVRAKQSQKAQLHQMLEEEYSTADVPLFNVTSKLHYSHHIMDDSRHLHPHLSWCWRGEDFMNVSSTLLSSCLRGRSDKQASIKALQKYCLGMQLAWEKIQ